MSDLLEKFDAFADKNVCDGELIADDVRQFLEEQLEGMVLVDGGVLTATESYEQFFEDFDLWESYSSWRRTAQPTTDERGEG